MESLVSMQNIGREMAKKLCSVGIDSPKMLRELGAEETFVRLKEVYPNMCVVFLYTLEGAITNREYNKLPLSRKKELKAFSDSLGIVENGS